MKNTSKLLALLLVVMTVLMSLSAITVSAAQTTGDTTIYLTPNENWKSEGARFALYTWDVSTNWYDMTDSDGDGVYECVIPAGVENVIFCRMNPNTKTNDWNNRWNQTSDLKYDGTNNHYTVTENTWDKGGGTWSLLEIGECIHTPVGEGTEITPATCTTNGVVLHSCSKCGEEYQAAILATGHNYEGAEAKCSCGAQASFTVAGDNTALFGTEWDPSNKANSLTFDETTQKWSISYVNSSSSEIWPNFKVCLDYGWNTCWGGAAAGQTDSNNAWVGVPAGYTLTITFDNTTKKLTMTASPAHVHSYEGTVTTPASCTTTGVMTYVCSCGDEYTEEIPAEHTWNNATCTEAKTCTVCGATEETPAGHTWTDATCTDPKTCTVCGTTDGDALGHDYVDGVCSRCDAKDPDHVDEPVVDEPVVDTPVVDDPVTLTLWDKIVAWFMSLIESILGFFKKA